MSGIIARIKPWQTSIAYYDVAEVHHEYDEKGWHCLQIEGIVGAWASYGDIAVLKWKDKLFAATTEYFWPELPEIFIIDELKRHDLEPEEPSVKKLKIVKLTS